MSTTATKTPSRRTAQRLPRGLNVQERERILHGADAASLSSRERAGALTSRALAGAPPTARSIVLELGRPRGLCVLAMGDLPAAVWRLDTGALYELAAAFASAVPRLDALSGLRAEASRLVLGMRLHALRGSIGDVVVVHDRSDAISRVVSAMLLEALVEHVWLEDEASTSRREGADCRSA